jgi:FtsP/CotA-like multicopper oxidase with cupredoxin domain
MWIFRNGGNSWAHPIHSHFTEFLILEVNGVPFGRGDVQDWETGEETIDHYFEGKPEPIKRFMGGKRRDVATLLPGDELKVVMRWTDFLGKYVMHCHNVVHEDHSMMVRWDIVEPGQGFVGSRPASAVYGTEEAPPHLESRPAASSFQEDQEEEREP